MWRGVVSQLEHNPNRRRESQRGQCSHPGCSETTTSSKPFCIQHIEELPYVKKLLEEIARRESLLGDSDPSGPDAADVLRQLDVHGAMTLPRLAREIELVPERLMKILRALEAAGRVSVIELRDDRGKRRRIVQPTSTSERPAAA